MTRRRALGLAVAGVGLAGFLASGYAMARAVAEYNETRGRELYAFQELDLRAFNAYGKPVTIEDVAGDAGQLVVRVTYGDDAIELTPTLEPGSATLPNLTRHKDWMRVLRFAPARGLTQLQFEEALNAGDIPDRAVIVVRRPPPGADADTYARVWRSDWRYEFIELLPEGGFKREILRYPSSGDDDEPKEGELAPGSWQLEAALGSWGFDPMSVMAPHASPGARSAREAVKASGLALPGATVSLLVCIGALALAFAPERRSEREP